MITDSVSFTYTLKLECFELSGPINFIEAGPMVVFCEASTRRCIELGVSGIQFRVIS
jgi:hypothetical protein